MIEFETWVKDISATRYAEIASKKAAKEHYDDNITYVAAGRVKHTVQQSAWHKIQDNTKQCSPQSWRASRSPSYHLLTDTILTHDAQLTEPNKRASKWKGEYGGWMERGQSKQRKYLRICERAAARQPQCPRGT